MIPLYQQIILSGLEEAFPSKSQEAHSRIHDHLAGVLDATMGARHGSESARFQALVEAELDEAGKAIAMKHAQHLVAAHDEAAKACAMECEGCYGDLMNAPSDTDADGNNPAAGIDPDHDGESQHTPPALTETTETHKEDKPLTEQEMLEALKAKGFKIEAPKSADEKLAELEAKIVEQAARLKTLQESTPAPQRQTIVAPSQLEESRFQPEEMYQEGDYLKGDLAPKNWHALADRRVPWPASVNPKQALHELAPLFVHKLLMREADARGVDITALVRPDEEI